MVWSSPVSELDADCSATFTILWMFSLVSWLPANLLILSLRIGILGIKIYVTVAYVCCLSYYAAFCSEIPELTAYWYSQYRKATLVSEYDCR